MKPPSNASCVPAATSSLDVVVRVSSAAQAEAEEGAAGTKHCHPEEDVDQGGDPEGKQVQVLVAVEARVSCVLVVVGLVNRVDPHISSYEPAEEKE